MFKFNYMKQLIIFFLLVFFLLISHKFIAQEPRVIDNKGTLKNINKVTKNDTGSKPTVDVVGGDVYVDELNGEVYIFNGKTSTWTSFTQYWSLKGNTLSATNNNFLGTKNDVKLQLRSNNKSIIEFGKRSTLGLPIISGSYPDIPITYIKNGDSSFSTIQFQSGGTNSYGKPMIRASNNFFMIRSGIPNNDFFQISSAGSHPNGRLEFVIGDDGNEPFVFERQCNTCGGREELFRVQGSGTNFSSKTRFGINTAGTMANSTLQIIGSFSGSIKTGTTNLTDEHYTVILDATQSVTLPNPSTCKGRIYIIRNSSSLNKNILGYKYRGLYESSGANSTIIPKNSVLKVQSDGVNWIMINNTETITTLTQSTDNTATSTVNISLPNGLTATQTTKTIATYKNENTVTTTINETVTSFVQDTNTNTTTAGNIFYNNEEGKTFSATVVSKDANNSIKVGTDGGAYLSNGIFAAGKVNALGNKVGGYNFSSNRYRIFGSYYYYEVLFNTPTVNNNYAVVATAWVAGENSDVRIVKTYGHSTNGFRLKLTNAAGSNILDTGFMFTVITYP